MKTKDLRSLRTLIGRFTLILALMLALCNLVWGQTTTTPRYAGLGENITGVGTFPWVGTTNIYTDDQTYASCPGATDYSLNSGEITNYLKASTFGFTTTTVPATATILGITATFNRCQNGSSGNYVYDNRVSLVKGGTIQSTNKATTTVWVNGGGALPSVTTRSDSYGGTTDLWGDYTWTPADINSSDFGVVLSAQNPNSSGRAAHVDYITISITYNTTPPTVTSFTGSPACSGSGASVVITGTNFTGATTVKFNGVSATTYTINSPTQITATLPATATTGAITVTTASGTGTSSSSFTVTTNTVSAASSTPTLCMNTALFPAITHTTTGAAGIGTPTNLPAGVTATWASNQITISGTPTSSGTFNYSIPLSGGCGTINATGTIIVNPLPAATVTNHTDITCYAANNGTITISASGGTSPYTFSVDNGASWDAATETDLRLYTGLLPNHPYQIRVMDHNNCTSPAIP